MGDDGRQTAPVQRTTSEGLRAFLDLSPQAVIVADEHGAIRAANAHACRLLHADEQRLRSLEVADLVPGEQRDAHARQRALFELEPRPRPIGERGQVRVRRIDGTGVPADIALQPVEVDGEAMTVVILHDLSRHVQLKNENDVLQHHADVLRRFITIASHELRTPLTSVKGFAETLLDGRADDPGARDQMLERIVRNADRQETIVAGLLDASRLESGNLMLEPELHQVDGLVADLVETLNMTASVTVDAPAIAVRVDRIRIEQVLTHLLTNALHYGRAPISLTVTLIGVDRHEVAVGDGGAGREADGSGSVAPAGYVRFRVTDHGPGVDPRFEPNLFDAFAQESVGNRREAHGLGLGLYVTRGVVELMGGTIGYERTADGQTRFDVVLPRA